MAETKLCACGQPLHYADPHIRKMVEHFVSELGETVRVTCRERTFLVPRHFIALHGLRAWEIPELAARYGFEELQ